MRWRLREESSILGHIVTCGIDTDCPMETIAPLQEASGDADCDDGDVDYLADFDKLDPASFAAAPVDADMHIPADSVPACVHMFHFCAVALIA